jgi:hypothetical protein
LKNLPQNNIFERSIFGVVLTVSLLIIVIPQYYITCDGPSHTYNSKIFFDYIFNNNRAFYKIFLTPNKSLDPNWTTQIILGCLTRFLPAWLADKAFQVIYVCGFAFGLRYCLLQINKSNVFLSSLFYPVCFTLAFQTGFYNYSLGIVGLLWSLGYFIRIKNDYTFPQLLLFAGLGLFTTLSHGMACTYLCLSIGTILLFEHWDALKQFYFKPILEAASVWIFALLSSIIITLFFSFKRGFGTTPHQWDYITKVKKFFLMFSNISTRHSETYPAMAFEFLLIIFTIIYSLKKSTTINNLGKAFITMTIFLFFSFVTCPADIGGAGQIDIRIAFLPWLFLILYLSSLNIESIHQKTITILGVLITLVFIGIRLPYVMQINEEAKSILSCEKYIANKSIIGTVHTHDFGSQLQFEPDNSMMHITDYLGANNNKQQLILQNYEADLNYFAMHWQVGFNPHESIDKLYQGNYPPSGDFANYESQTGYKVNYVYQLGLDSCHVNLINYAPLDTQYNKAGQILGILYKRH